MSKSESVARSTPDQDAFADILLTLSNWSAPPTGHDHFLMRRAAQERERLLDGGRYVDVVTGDAEKDHLAVGRMWLAGG